MITFGRHLKTMTNPAKLLGEWQCQYFESACYTHSPIFPYSHLSQLYLFSLPVIPLFLTIPNGFASLETVYIKRNSTSGNSTSRFQPLYEFEVFDA